MAPVAVKLLGPAQLNVVPVVEEVPVSVTLVVAQVREPDTEAVTPAGAVIFCVMAAEAVDVHPLLGLVTVRLYVPGAVTVAAAVETAKLGPAQAKVVPEVEELPVRTILVLLQVSRLVPELLVIVAPGAELLAVTVIVPVPDPVEFVAVTV